MITPATPLSSVGVVSMPGSWLPYAPATDDLVAGRRAVLLHRGDAGAAARVAGRGRQHHVVDAPRRRRVHARAADRLAEADAERRVLVGGDVVLLEGPIGVDRRRRAGGEHRL